MSDVRVSLEQGSGLERRMHIAVPARRIEEELRMRLRDAGRTATLKGFRRGKVPEKIIRQHFGAQIRREVLQEVVQSSYSEAIVQENLRPAGNPRIEAESLVDGQDFAYTAVFEVYPEFQVGGLEDLRIEKANVSVTEDDVDRTLERLRRQRGLWRAVERAAAAGDRVTVDFEGRLDGALIEGGKAEKVEVVLGDRRMLPDFEDGLIGVAPGGSASILVRFPADYHEHSLRSQDVNFDVRVTEVAEREPAEVDAEFVRSYGVDSGDVVDFRRLIRENLEKEADARVQADMKRQVMEQLLARNAIDLPSVLVDRESAALQAEGMRNLGIRDPAEAPPLEAYRDVAQRRVRLGLIVGALIREQDLKLDQARVDNRLDEMCRSYDRPEEVRKLYLQNPGLMSQVENSVMEEQAMAWLIDRAKVTTRNATLAEFGA